MGTYWSSYTIFVVYLTRKEVIKSVCGFHYFLEILFTQAISSFLQTAKINSRYGWGLIIISWQLNYYI